MKLVLPLVALAAMSMAGAPANAITSSGAVSSVLRAPLGCTVHAGKTLVITTTVDITAGTQMGYDAVRYGNGQHFGKTFTGPAVTPATPLQIHVDPATSCTAWYRRPLMMAPSP